VLVVKKFADPMITVKAVEVAGYLDSIGLTVLVDSWRNALDLEDRYEVVNPRKMTEPIDLVVCLGGDGTILHANQILNQHSEAINADGLPPVVSLAMGSLGFLTPFRADEWRETLDQILNATSSEEATPCSLRNRLICTSSDFRQCVLNDIVISRGVSPSLCKLACQVDGQPVALFQSDGLIIATPSGSTAYSLSAGGTMIAPSVACTLMTPIAPHSLSSRPVGIHNEAKIEVTIPESARAAAFITFDGREPMVELRVGDSLNVEKCPLSLPLMTKFPSDHEWFHSLTTKLGWNTRIEQKPLIPGSDVDRNNPSSSDIKGPEYPPIKPQNWRRF